MGTLSIFAVLRKVTAFQLSEGLIMKTLISTLILGFCLAIAGCNTFQGVGQDIQKAGEKIEDAAKKK
jgi:predicted small secreted protein